jgi:hypothetical protein
MIKTLFYWVACLILGLGSLSAQITIEQADLPEAGDRPRFSIADTLLMIDPEPTGANYSWDFRNLNPIAQRVDSFIGRSDLPFTLLFQVPSSANVVSFIRAGGQQALDSLPGGFSFSGGYEIYRSTADAYELLGQATVLSDILPIYLENDPVDTVYRLPMDFGQVDSSISQAILDLNIPGLGSIYYQQDRKRINEVDGWGTLLTPYGTFDVLRVRTEITGRDTVSWDTITSFAVPAIPSIEYKWLAKADGFPILQVNATRFLGAEVVSNVIYRDSLRPEVPTVGLEAQLEPLEVKLYPNPVQQQLNLQIGDLRGQQAHIRLLDGQGRILLHQTTRQDRVRIDLKAQAAGMYLLEIVTPDRYYWGKVMKK